ncbi:MAG: hypothetical protein PW843_24515 [Azospirillaceae bacterium]|nr:hypothetical protein [Azospirillaceae bacterium]
MQITTIPYGAQVRLMRNPDGSISVADMSYQALEILIADDGTVTPTRELPPRTITTADPEYGALVNAIDTAMAADNANLTAANTALTGQLQAAQAALASVTAERDALLQSQVPATADAGGAVT